MSSRLLARLLGASILASNLATARREVNWYVSSGQVADNDALVRDHRDSITGAYLCCGFGSFGANGSWHSMPSAVALAQMAPFTTASPPLDAWMVSGISLDAVFSGAWAEPGGIDAAVAALTPLKAGGLRGVIIDYEPVTNYTEDHARRFGAFLAGLIKALAPLSLEVGVDIADWTILSPRYWPFYASTGVTRFTSMTPTYNAQNLTHNRAFVGEALAQLPAASYAAGIGSTLANPDNAQCVRAGMDFSWTETAFLGFVDFLGTSGVDTVDVWRCDIDEPYPAPDPTAPWVFAGLANFLAGTAAEGLAPAPAPKFVTTPFGSIHPSCILGVPSGTLIEEAVDSELGKHVRVTYPNKTVARIPPCASFPRASNSRLHGVRVEYAPGLFAPARARPAREGAVAAQTGNSNAAPAKAPLRNTPCHNYPPPSTCPPVWEGWAQHWWFGLWWADFTAPPLPKNETIFALNATWTVPNFPPNQSANETDPWFQSPPTESWWSGLQGPSVLQPVLEYNGLMPRSFDGVSWNCCPGGMAWYSFPLIALPGETIVGVIQRVDGAAIGAQDSLYVYETITGVLSAERGYQETILYSALSRDEPGWIPNWAEIVQESYFVTSCDRLPCSPPAGAFSNVSVSIAPAEVPFGELSPADVVPVPLPPWSVSYEVEGASGQRPVCSGAASAPTAGLANVAFDCTAPH
jgi:hypothetical protein